MEQICRNCKYRYEGVNPKKACPYCGNASLIVVERAEELIDESE